MSPPECGELYHTEASDKRHLAMKAVLHTCLARAAASRRCFHLDDDLPSSSPGNERLGRPAVSAIDSGSMAEVARRVPMCGAVLARVRRSPPLGQTVAGRTAEEPGAGAKTGPWVARHIVH